MVKHIILLKLKENALGKPTAENARMLKREFLGMPARIKEILKLEVGINFNTGKDAYDSALIAEFANKQDLDAYQIHPEHQRVVGIIRQHRDVRIVVDYEMEGPDA